MTAYAGEKVELRIGDGAQPVESFTAIGGMRLTQLQLQQTTTDASNLTDDGWRRLIQGGQRSLSVSGEGFFSDSASEISLLSAAFVGSIDNFQLHFGNGDVISGSFLVSNYERVGDIGEAEQFRVTLESAGSVSVA